MTVAGQPAMPVAVSVSGPRPILLTAAPAVGGTLVTSDRLPLNIRLMLALGGDPDPGTFTIESGVDMLIERHVSLRVALAALQRRVETLEHRMFHPVV